ncbi:hypothetical protein [Streptomyces sp. NPDC056399]|uniref:hypothetical protein n=1 Tax=Streptomyces sp. NPDC056399 TaxID=3345807 RepID=UPI0035E35AFA
MALRITIDMFSGRPNPSWEISDPDQVGYLEELLLRTPEARGEVHSGYTGLGFDGVRVEFTEGPGREGLPQRFELAGGAAKDEAASAELAAKLVETMPSNLSEGGGIDNGTWYADAMRTTAQEEIARTRRADGGGRGASTGPGDQQRTGVTDEATGVTGEATGVTDEVTGVTDEVREQLRRLADGKPFCAFDSQVWAPEYWNHPLIEPYNNCYAYAVAIRTDTFARPGRKHGYEIPATMLGFQVAVGLYKDGLSMYGFPCQPPGSSRFVVGLCTGTFSTGVRDFHFYRYHLEGFWSHKRAGNAARKTDESGRLITDPTTCDRGIYTEWYGLFQSNALVTIR